jgi:hypothetical protein
MTAGRLLPQADLIDRMNDHKERTMAETKRWTRVPRAGWLVAVLALPAAGYVTACGDGESDDEATASPTTSSTTVTSTDSDADGFCADLERWTASVEAFMGAAEAASPDEVRSSVEAVSSQASDLATRAPTQVDSAMSDLAGIFDRLDEELRARDYGVARLADDGASPIEDDTFDESGEDIDEFLTSTCEVAPDE